MVVAAWHLWLMGAIVLFIAEVLTPGGFILACLGAACLAASLAAVLQVGYPGQIISFAGAALILFFGIRPLFVKYFVRNAVHLKTNVEALIGKAGLVLEDIDPHTRQGRVKVGGEDWKAISAEETFIPAGEKVVVVGVEGVKVIVKKYQ